MAMQRPAALASCIDLLCDAMRHGAKAHPPARELARQLDQALHQQVGHTGQVQACRLAVCEFLDQALARTDLLASAVAPLARALAVLAPSLAWYQRPAAAGDDSGFHAGHANALIISPSALECRSDLAIGVSLLAPHVVYPRHHHAPREIYTVLSQGDWFTEDQQWYTPGLGGTVYHDANQVHAMRSGPAPLLAIWCLWMDR